MEKLIEDFKPTWSQGMEDLGQTNVVEHKIVLKENIPPIKQAPRSIPFHKQGKVQTMIDEMLDNKIIENSNSPWASPVVLAPKPDGTIRFCIDYRRLNSETKIDVYPLPKIEDLLNQLDGAKYFAKLDLAAGYWQVRMQDEDKEKTAFCVPNGLYQWKYMPFGLVNAPPTFQRLMGKVLKTVLGKIALVYIDDVLVYAKSIDELIANLRKVLQLLQEAGLKLKPKKCELFKEKIDFLGHEVSERGLRPLSSKIDAFKDWPDPMNEKEYI